MKTVYRVWKYTDDGARYSDFDNIREAKAQAVENEEMGFRTEIQKTDNSYIPTLRW